MEERDHPATPLCTRIVADIEAGGCAVVREAVPRALVSALRARVRALDADAGLAPAAVGHGATRSIDPVVRGDRIHWVSDAQATPDERALLALLEALRRALNQALQLGLFELELHYALYAPGARYAAHRDRFRDDDARVVSLVLYLNEDWDPAAGGALRLHRPAGVVEDIVPAGGTLVAFLSEAFVHEVLPATRERYSVTGWFRRRA